MTRWFDRAVEELEQELQDGLISQAEFNAQMRDLNAEFRDAAYEAGEAAREDYLNGW
jgi:hypothetical protein